MALACASDWKYQTFLWTSDLKAWLWQQQTSGIRRKQMTDTISAIVLSIPQDIQFGAADYNMMLKSLEDQ